MATEPGCQYMIRIRGRLGATALSAFPAMESEVGGGETVLTGSLEDQSAVYGVLAQIEGLGLMDGWWPDLAKFEDLEAERFELRQDPVHRGRVLE